MVWLGSFKTEVEAAWAYNEYVKTIFTDPQVNDIQKPDGFKPYQYHKKGDLPKGIKLTKDKTFCVAINFEKKVYHAKTYKTLEEAKKMHLKYSDEIKVIKLQNENTEKEKPIKRNDSGIAILSFKDGKNFVDVMVDDDIYLTYLLSSRYINQGYPTISSHKSSQLHTLIMPNASKNEVVDHINRNKLEQEETISVMRVMD
jgi:hypothetical protein